MEIKFDVTGRGFEHLEFKDRYGEKCSIQKSSLASENAIWFGIDKPKAICRTSSKPFIIPNDVYISGRMHLTQEQVRGLLPYLIHFADTGNIPFPEDIESPQIKEDLLNNAIQEAIQKTSTYDPETDLTTNHYRYIAPLMPQKIDVQSSVPEVNQIEDNKGESSE